MRIALVTDAWLPQTNGVVRTLSITVEHLRAMGHHVEIIRTGALSYRSVPDVPGNTALAVAIPAARAAPRPL
jgi:hypothetical protein